MKEQDFLIELKNKSYKPIDLSTKLTSEDKKKAKGLLDQINKIKAELKILKQKQLKLSQEKQKLNQTKRSVGNSTDALMTLLNKECSEIINLYRSNKKFLYRGVSDSYNKPVFFLKPRDDRNSLTDNTAQEIIDNYLKSKKFVALRSNSFFCTSDYHTASGYGESYIIFPKNGFKYTYSPKSWDLVDDIDFYSLSDAGDYDTSLDFSNIKSFVNSISYLDGDDLKDEKKVDKSLKKFLLTKLNSIRNGLKNNTLKPTNIMFNYLKIKPNHFLDKNWSYNHYSYETLNDYIHDSNIVTDIKNNVKNPITKLFINAFEMGKKFKELSANKELDSLNFTNKNLEIALKKSNEVYIHGGCYFVEQDRFENVLKKQIFKK